MFRRAASIINSRPRVRNLVLLVGAYRIYDHFRNTAFLYKTFTAHRHHPGQTVLDLDLHTLAVVSTESSSPFETAEQITMDSLVDVLDSAKRDPRITGLVVRGIAGLSGIGLANVGELRSAIQDFSKGWGGKPTLLHVPEGIGGAGNGTIPMYFASAFDSVHIQPTSEVIVPGLSFAEFFFKKLLDSVGISAQVIARKEFKTAANAFTEEKYTKAHRESTEALLDSVLDNIVQAIANGRRLSKEEVQRALDKGVMTAPEAREAGLIDESVYRDELPKLFREKLKSRRSERADLRPKVEGEWLEAMKNLKAVYIDTTNEGYLLNMPDTVDEFTEQAKTRFWPTELFVGHFDIVEKYRSLIIQALRAHLQWLDNCPWESAEFTDVHANSTLYRVSNIASIIELERQLCIDGIKTLEEFPKKTNLLPGDQRKGDSTTLNAREDAPAVTINLDDFMRWWHTIARTYCFFARMYESLPPLRTSNPSAEGLKDYSFPESMPPFSFLLQEPVLLDPYSLITTSRISSKLPEQEHTGVDREDESTDASETSSLDKDQSVFKACDYHYNLRYVRVTDYMDLLGKESRIATRTLSGGRFFKRHSKPAPEYFDETQDPVERRVLRRLRQPMVPFHESWKVLQYPKRPLVAVIRIEGVIGDATADSIRSYIRRAGKDYRIKAIVLRVDSPGGSVTASDLISRAVAVTEKPIVVSMGNVCASGGYYISAPGDKILCDPATITGSIGVIMQSINTAGLFDKVGVSTDRVDRGRFSKYFGSAGAVLDWDSDFTVTMNKLIDGMYDNFVNIVAYGRGLEFDEAERIARGRVWSGADAKRLGLADEFGGLRQAVEIASELAGLPPDAKPRGVTYPSKAMLWEDALRRNGVLPSRLNEEGDEAVPQRRSSRGWYPFAQDTDEDGSSDAAENDSKDGTVSAMWPYLNLFSLDQDGAGIVEACTRALLHVVDSNQLEEKNSVFSHGIHMLLGRLGHKFEAQSAASAVREQAEAAHATAGRPAAISPSIAVDDRRFV